MTPSQVTKLLSATIPARLPVLLTGSPGVGKCLAPGTPVIMFDGTIKPVELIKVGDSLMGPNSTPRWVTSVASGEDQMYRITPVKGQPFVCNGPHILSLKISKRRPTDEVSIVNISVDEYLTRNTDFKHHAKLWRTGVDFPCTGYPVDPYLLGVWLGDGHCSSAQITLGLPHKQPILDYIHGWAKNNQYLVNRYSDGRDGKENIYTLGIVKRNGNDKHPGEQFTSNPLQDFLRGCVSTGEKRIPHSYLANAVDYRLSLLAGIIDTDGEVTHGTASVVSRFKGLADDIAFLAGSLGFCVTRRTITRGIKSTGFVGTYYAVRISGDVCTIPCLVVHKQATPRKQIKNPLVTGFTVEPIGIGAYHGFTIGGDHLFLLGDFTVTHNTDLVVQAAAAAECEIVISHPVVSDPTDAKGLPWPDKDSMTARFLPLGEVAELLECTRPTVWFLDDLGQAAPATQAAYMQWLLARRVNGHVLPEHVTIIAATNRRQDRAGVQGILEPVKSRFASIVEVNASVDEWCNWAVGADIETTVLAFLRYKPELLCAPNPTADMSNAPSPRTWANLSRLAGLGLPADVRLPVYTGAVGAGAAVEYLAYEQMFGSLVTADQIMMNPATAEIPTKLSELYAVSTALAAKVTKDTAGRMLTYCDRVCEAGKGEFSVLCVRDAARRTPALSNTREFIAMFSDSRLGSLIKGEVPS